MGNMDSTNWEKRKIKLSDINSNVFSIIQQQVKAGKDKQGYETINFGNKRKKIRRRTLDLVTKLKNKKSWVGRILMYIGPKLFSNFYDWDKLKNSLLTEGYAPEENTYIRVKEKIKIDGSVSYRCLDGNHRIKLLRELYGYDYEIEVQVTTSWLRRLIYGPKIVRHPDKEACPTFEKRNMKKYFKDLITDKQTIIKTIKMVSVFTYLLLFNFKYFIWILLSLFAYSVLTTTLEAINYTEKLNNIRNKLNIENPLIRKTILTILINIPTAVVLIPITIISLLMIINGPLEFLILGVIVYLCEVNEKGLTDD